MARACAAPVCPLARLLLLLCAVMMMSMASSTSATHLRRLHSATRSAGYLSLTRPELQTAADPNDSAGVSLPASDTLSGKTPIIMCITAPCPGDAHNAGVNTGDAGHDIIPTPTTATPTSDTSISDTSISDAIRNALNGGGVSVPLPTAAPTSSATPPSTGSLPGSGPIASGRASGNGRSIIRGGAGGGAIANGLSALVDAAQHGPLSSLVNSTAEAIANATAAANRPGGGLFVSLPDSVSDALASVDLGSDVGTLDDVVNDLACRLVRCAQGYNCQAGRCLRDPTSEDAAGCAAVLCPFPSVCRNGACATAYP